MKKNFWKSKKIFITGVTGFVGSNLAKNLVSSGSKVIGLTKERKMKSLLFYEKINKKINLINGNITDKKLIKKIIERYKIDICFHLAAQVEVGRARHKPFETWETNIKGTYSFLDAVRESRHNVKSIVIASSDKAYGEYGLKHMPYRENYQLKALYPYDTSKACADMIAQTYSSSLYNLPIITTRFSNIYGPGQINFTALIPDSIKSCINNKKFIIRGNGEDVRDFIYIDDIVDLYKLLSKNLFLKPKKYNAEVFNAGTNTPHKIKDVLKKLFFYKNKKKEYFELIKKAKKNKTTGEISVQFMDYKKLKKFFNWNPKKKLDDVIPTLYTWYENYLKNENRF